MPEGPEIRRAADRLAAAVVGRTLRRVQFAFPQLKPYETELAGRRILSVTPRGKALLTAFDSGWTLYTHNQLYGVWKVVRAGERPETERSLRVVLETEDAAVLLYSASDIEMWRSDEVEFHPSEWVNHQLVNVAQKADELSSQRQRHGRTVGLQPQLDRPPFVGTL